MTPIEKQYFKDEYPEYSPIGHAVKWAENPMRWPIPEEKLRDAILWIAEFAEKIIDQKNELENGQGGT